jgi:transposase
LGRTRCFLNAIEDWIDEDNPVRVVDIFVDELDLAELGFDGVDPEATGRPSYHPSVLLKLYIYGYLKREAGRNVEVMWLLGRLAPDHKTIADFRKDNGRAIRQVCARFVALCRTMGLLTEASVAINGSKFKAVNNRDKNFTRAKMERRMAQIEESVARHLQQLDSADRQEPSEAFKIKTDRLKEKIEKLREQMQRLEILKVAMLATADQQISLTNPDARSMATSGRAPVSWDTTSRSRSIRGSQSALKSRNRDIAIFSRRSASFASSHDPLFQPRTYRREHSSESGWRNQAGKRRPQNPIAASTIAATTITASVRFGT